MQAYNKKRKYSAKAKIFTQVGSSTDVCVGREVKDIRKQIDKSKANVIQAEIRNQIEAFVDIDHKTYLDKYCRGHVYTNSMNVPTKN
jgi:hypothetical protein